MTARSRLVLSVSLSSRDLQAFRILLLMETGWSPEQLTDLRLGDIEWGDGKVSVTTQKLRARTMKSHEYYKGLTPITVRVSSVALRFAAASL